MGQQMPGDVETHRPMLLESEERMVLTISLPTEDETRLRDRARAAGQDLGQYVQQLIARELVAPLSLAEAAEPMARAVEGAGASEDEFTAAILKARDAARRARRRRPA